MKLLIGCPVFRREWILPLWFEHVEKECLSVGIEPTYVFVVDPRDPSLEIIKTRFSAVVLTAEEDLARSDTNRRWSEAAVLEKMVVLRNMLLGKVRQLNPHMFLSLDSDILLSPGSLANLIETFDREDLRWDAVGGKAYMSQGRENPSWFKFTSSGTPVRSDSDGVHIVDAIMAIKLMSPSAYGVDYVYHQWGEDIGWSIACKEAGLTLGWDGRITNKHVMMHDQVLWKDERCGY